MIDDQNNNNHSDNADRIADLVEGSAADPFAGAPHPAEGRGSHEERGDFDGAIDDDAALSYGLDDRDNADDVSSAAVELCVSEPPNDTGNGKRLLHHFGGQIMHVRAVGWHVWTGSRWKNEGGAEAVERMAQLVAARIVLEADAMSATPLEHRAIEIGAEAKAALDAHLKNKPEDADDAYENRRKELLSLIADGEGARRALQGRKIARRKYAISSGNSGKITGMIERAKPHCTVGPADLDADPLAFNVANGTIYFAEHEFDDPDGSETTNYKRKEWRAELRPHNRLDRITKCSPVDYDPKAPAPKYIDSMLRFQPNEPTRNFLQRYHGYAITGQTGEQCLVFNFGDGANWKSTFNEIVARVMGDYSATINFASIAGDAQASGSQASPDIARLPGARLVRSSEPDRGVPFKESLIKSLTGGEPILTRHNYGEFFEFLPTFKMVLAGNHKPEIGGVDHGIWRRIRFVLWPTKIPDNERRAFNEVMAELWAERSGILNWLVAGACDYLGAGLRTPQEVLDSTAAYREEMDPVGCFLGDCVVSVPVKDDGSSASTVAARAMYDAFVSWCYSNGVRAWKEKSFATAMSQKGFVKHRVTSSRVYIDVKLHDVPIRPRVTQGGHEPPHPADNDEAIPV
jgi:putative DNA primase/helicase